MNNLYDQFDFKHINRPVFIVKYKKKFFKMEN